MMRLKLILRFASTISLFYSIRLSPKDTIGDLKKLIAAQKGTKPEKVGCPPARTTDLL